MKKKLLFRSMWLAVLTMGLGSSGYAQQESTGKDTARLPGKVEVFSYERGQWMFESRATYSFTPEGLLKVFETETRHPEEGAYAFNRSTFDAYDAAGMSHLNIDEVSDDGKTWRKEVRIESAYDPVEPKVCVLQKASVWDDLLQQWSYDPDSYYNWYKNIVRDEQGRMLENRMWDSEEMRYGYLSYTFEYGGKPHAETVCVLMDNKPCYAYENIDWYRCSDQHLWISNELIWGLCDGQQNLPKSYDVYELPEGGPKSMMGTSTFWFDENDRLVKRVYRNTQTNAVTCERYEFQVEGKNCDVDYYDSWIDSNGDGEPNGDEEIWTRNAYARLYDEHGSQVENLEYQMDDAGTYVFKRGEKYVHTYDADGVRLETIELKYNAKTEIYEEKQKLVFSDFVEVETGMETAVKEQLNLRVEENRIVFETDRPLCFAIYTLNGRLCRKGTARQTVELNGLPAGLYVVTLNGEGVKTSLKVMRP